MHIIRPVLSLQLIPVVSHGFVRRATILQLDVARSRKSHSFQPISVLHGSQPIWYLKDRVAG